MGLVKRDHLEKVLVSVLTTDHRDKSLGFVLEGAKLVLLISATHHMEAVLTLCYLRLAGLRHYLTLPVSCHLHEEGGGAKEEEDGNFAANIW